LKHKPKTDIILHHHCTAPYRVQKPRGSNRAGGRIVRSPWCHKLQEMLKADLQTTTVSLLSHLNQNLPMKRLLGLR